MKLEKQVTSLELSKKLKELGVKQESLFHWSPFGELVFQPKVEIQKEAINLTLPEAFIAMSDDTRTVMVAHTEIVDKQYVGVVPFEEYTSAFTVAELGEMLPKEFYVWKNNNKIRGGSDGFFVPQSSRISFGLTSELEIRDKSEANVRAKMLIYLLENKLL